MKPTIKAIFFGLAVSVFMTQTSAAQYKLTLQDAVHLAETNNPDIAASRLEREKTHEQKVVSRSLFLPTVSASAQVNHFFQLNPFFGFGESTTQDKIPYGRFGGEDQVGAFVTAVQPLYNPGSFPSLRYSVLRESESEIALDAQRVYTLSVVKQTYLRILVLKERVKLQQESIDRNQRVLEDSKSLFFQGRGLRVDTLRAYTAVRNLEPGLLKLNFAVETDELRLKALTGIDSLQAIKLVDSLFLPGDVPVPAEEEVYSIAKNSPEYRILVLQEELKQQQVNISSSARLPHLSAVAQYQLQSQTNSFDYGKAYYPSSSFVGLQLAVPLFTGFSNQAKVREARLSKSQTELKNRYAFEQLRATVHQVVADNRESLSRLESTVSVRETAKLSYDIVQYRYKRGISSRLELTDAELELSTAESNYLEAVYDYLSSQIALERLLGRTE